MNFLNLLTAGLILVAILVMFVGLTQASGAPQEAAADGIACFFGILARMSQAAAQHLDK